MPAFARARKVFAKAPWRYRVASSGVRRDLRALRRRHPHFLRRADPADEAVFERDRLARGTLLLLFGAWWLKDASHAREVPWKNQVTPWDEGVTLIITIPDGISALLGLKPADPNGNSAALSPIYSMRALFRENLYFVCRVLIEGRRESLTGYK
jgi:hypothetical protein